MATRAIRALFAALLLFATTSLGQTAAAAPTSLNGERLQQSSSESWSTATCDPAGISTIEYFVTGIPEAGVFGANGPYPGTFTEHGIITLGPQTHAPYGVRLEAGGFYTYGSRGFTTGQILSAEVEFAIDSPNGQVIGTKTYDGSPDAFGQCVTFEDAASYGEFTVPETTATGYAWGVRGTLQYDAEIQAASGTTSDTGTALLAFEELKVVRSAAGSAFGANFVEFFTSGLVPPGATSVALSPATAVNDVGTVHTVTATARTATAQPVPGLDVDFTVAGSVNTTRRCTTDLNGLCSISYTGPTLPGADLIVGCADNDGDGVHDVDEPCGEATKAWLLPSSTPGQVTGGGHVLNPMDGEEVAFGFNAQSGASGLKGNCSVVDKAPVRNVKIKCLTIDSLVRSGNHATFFGQATVNGVVGTYRIDVADNGEPGTGRDTFAIQTSSGYSAGGLLDNGNAQVHE